MTKYKKYLFFLILFLVLISCVYAEEKHIKLLAVSEQGDEYQGVVADLGLELKPGQGRVFLNTQPLTKFDTQLSTRFAKEIACDFLNVDCSEYDFFYEIKSNSIIVGGPSAGSAVALLTIATIKNLDLKDDIAMTGTINPGGLIGPVGGLKAKIEAAQEGGISKVLIPRGEVSLFNDSNFSIDVIEVGEINDAVYELTGEDYSVDKELIIDESYVRTMKMLAEMLCGRNQELIKNVTKLSLDNETRSNYDQAVNLSIKAQNAFNESLFYSAASYCFASNVESKKILYSQEEFTSREFFINILELRTRIQSLELKAENKEKNTISDLQTYMVVRERLVEAKDVVKDLEEKRKNDILDTDELAYADERIYSAVTWSEFFDKGGKEFKLTDVELKRSCVQKISEAEERFQYIENLYSFLPLEHIQREINHSKEDFDKEEYALCLFKATNAKAEADVILSTMNINNEYIKDYLKNKLEIIKRKIAVEAERNVFPILAYSYYELSNSLIDEDLYSAFVYSEYALELSDLEIYFKEKESFGFRYDFKNMGVFLLGIAFGVIIMVIAFRSSRKIKKHKKRRK